VQGAPLAVNYVGAVVSYICVFLALIFYAIPTVLSHMPKTPTLKDQIINSFMYAGGLGLVIYGVFNYTNIAIFENYSYSIALLDTTWGVTLFSLSALFYTIVFYRK
jgi:uncharacterized membrane protein